MKLFASCKLTHTLQTRLGMVVDNGAPAQRPYHTLPRYLVDGEEVNVQNNRPYWLSDEESVRLYTQCVLECRLPRFLNTHLGDDARRLPANIAACCNRKIDAGFMKHKIATLQRMDLEQAAAVVMSAVQNDSTNAVRAEIVEVLIQGLDMTLFVKSCMWLETYQRHPTATLDNLKFARLVLSTQRLVLREEDLTNPKYVGGFDHITDWPSILPLLLRIRRTSPKTRALFIPEWMFVEAGIAVPAEFQIWDQKGRAAPGHEPVCESKLDSIFLTRKKFRSLQRRLLRYFRFWDPEKILRKAIRDLQKDVEYSARYIQTNVLPCDDTLAVAHYFFALQRRLQRKVVSELGGGFFLEKGESGNILQNNPDIPTAFEEQLAAFSGQSGVPVTGPLLPQMDLCCLLMEEYVRVYGKGDCSNLVFVPGVRGGSGRGAVDEYNLLCDILKVLCKAAKREGLPMPGPVRKFLAKDIMAWNSSFSDDAFAGGRVPGWEAWLAQRREVGLLEDIQALGIA